MKNFSTAHPGSGSGRLDDAAFAQPCCPDSGALAAWLALALSDGVSSGHGRRLLSAFGLPGEVLRASRAALCEVVPASVADALGRGARVQEGIRKTLEWVAQPDRHILCLDDARYPRSLLEIPDPPLLLYAEGDIALLRRDAVAVVGSRNATQQGVQHAGQFALKLSQAGLVVVSGLALGIDAAAHAGGLRGPGASVAVIGTGIDLCYPQDNQDLARQLRARGCIISEYPLGTPPLAANFPRRNRLISGLALGVLVVEAAPRSGSLITARMAADQGREVFAIPGSIHSPLSKGCHALLRQGAKLVETIDDILDELGTDRVAQAQVAHVAAAPVHGHLDMPPEMEHEACLVITAMGHDPVDLDTLAQRCSLDASALAAALLSLELAGCIELLPGPRYRRRD